MSKHFAFMAPPAYGHVNPTLPLVEELLARGHRVSYATGPLLAPTVEKTGAAVVELPWALDISKLTGTAFTVETFGELMNQTLHGTRAGFPVLLERFESDRPDALCFDMSLFGAAILAERLAVPQVTLIPNFASNKNFDLWSTVMSPGFSGEHPAFLEFHAEFAEFAAEQGVSTTLARGKALALERLTGLKLVFIPRSFQVAGDTFDDTYRFIGPSLGARAHSDDWKPPSDGAPILFVSLGTAFNKRPDFFSMCTEAFGGGPWHVVMAVGDKVDIAQLGPIPPNFEVRPYFPQPTVLSHSAAFVSHAGMNSTMESLYYAVPIVAVPQMPEQAANAKRADELGFGRCLDSAALSPQLLGDTVNAVANDPVIRANLAKASVELRDGGGAVDGADALEAYLLDAA